MQPQENSLSVFLSPQEVWDELVKYNTEYYSKYSAAYSGIKEQIANTAEPGSFWKRNGKCRIHVPIASDIAATSSDLLFSEEPSFTCFDKGTEDGDAPNQKRLDEIIALNGLGSILNEAAESSSALGDVYLKLSARPNEIDYPLLTITQGDCAWPEYVLGVLKCIHFFTVLKKDKSSGKVWRIYERYERGKITMEAFEGTSQMLGAVDKSGILAQLGYENEVAAPIPDMMAVHIPNMRPNRYDRSSAHGRSDFDGLRDLMDSLDEVYSSWMRDIRLGKARLIVPADYLRRRAADLFKDGQYTYEFDEDVETLVALDIDPEQAGAHTITPSQFEIRSKEHAETCIDLVRNIVSKAGYSPQTFGIDVEGNAQSGTALHIREKKSYKTQGKKQTYWKAPLEYILTAMVHLDAALYPQSGSRAGDSVKVHFADGEASDLSTISSAVEMLHRAQAASTEIKVRMLHPDWSKKQIDEEVARVKNEFDMMATEPDMMQGDLDDPNATIRQVEDVEKEDGGEDGES